MSIAGRQLARALDFAMCALMNAVQCRCRLRASSRAELERYIAQCERMTREEFFQAPPAGVVLTSCHSERSGAQPRNPVEQPSSITDITNSERVILSAAKDLANRVRHGFHPNSAPHCTRDSSTAPSACVQVLGSARNDKADGPAQLRWQSPIRTAFPENNRVHVNLFPCERGWSAPTVLMLHALMSASDTGYRLWAKRFNARGWNACFVHLPYHYSRKPRGCFNGELAISADLVRTAEGLRQGVIELRQLVQLLRERGCGEFGLWATSYGGWIGALLLPVERDFRFAALMAPIVNIEHAIWKSAAAVRLRSELRRHGITHALVERHFHLTSPMRCEPLCGGERVLLAAGEYDQIALCEDIVQLHEKWRGSEMLRVAQGHFGYCMMPAVFERLIERGLL